MSESKGSPIGWAAALGIVLVGLGLFLIGLVAWDQGQALISAILELAEAVDRLARAMEARP